MSKTLDWNRYVDAAVRTVSEGVILLKNEKNVLPLDKNSITAVFGRIQLHYYKSGTGSGGMVNVSKVTGITDGLIESGAKINDELLSVYKEWDEADPFDCGAGWGTEPWSQKEMPLSDEIAAKAAESGDTAVVIIGRTAGEEQDNKLEKGSYYLTDTETDMLKTVRRNFGKMAVLLNIGGIIDLSFMDSEETAPDALMIVWQGGMIGGTGTARVLTGEVSPSGKLPDTIAYNISDHASDRNFGDPDKCIYAEDIYVGYRYFETFAKDKVRYPFGYGLSYTDFELKCDKAAKYDDRLDISVNVKNIGAEYSGKEVVQLYCEAPQGALGKPARSLCAFEKTGSISPYASWIINFDVDIKSLASYDDSGKTGHKNCFVLEAGEYNIYVGTDVRSAVKCLSFTVDETRVISQHRQVLAPYMSYDRILPLTGGCGITEGSEPVPLNENDVDSIIAGSLPAEIPQTGDRGIKLADVKSGKNTMDEFIAQLSDNDLACIIRGEGMGSPKVTPGTTSAFAGVTQSLIDFGIPSCCTSDGPSGMRLDCGTKAFSLPNGTLIASTFNKELVHELFALAGLEIAYNKVDCLLGPGMNIHRHPLNGRNFEYFSEDPLLCGEMAAAELNGLHTAGVTGTIKHFCCNNQELNRHFLDSVVSQRALREIYLKGFEIAVKKGNAKTIMTTYGSLNGVWTAGNYELNTMLLRDDWHYTGVTMTDWWANINRRNCAPDKKDFAIMARAQNDMYMVCPDSSDHEDNTLEMLASGGLTRGELQRNAKNICTFAMNTRAMDRLIGNAEEIEIINRPQEDSDGMDMDGQVYDLEDEVVIPLDKASAVRGSSYVFVLNVKKFGDFDVAITASSESSELAQIPVTMFVIGIPWGTFTFNGTGGKPVTVTRQTQFYSRYTTVRLYFGQSGLKPESITFKLKREGKTFANV
ncbi:MAG: glycoside hydrolase family 3 protein [Ruminiclostridium sp.]|nr:glycoside hydrolase family 3 protein [Ruminiclostridium sp.]